MPWPRGGKMVYVQVLITGVRKQSHSQMIIVRPHLDEPLRRARSWTLDADDETWLIQIAARWDIEALFGDCKEEPGLDHSQLMSASLARPVATPGDR